MQQKKEYVLSLFANVDKKDPILNINGSTITFHPIYWTYSFVIKFLPLSVSVYALTQQDDFATSFLFIGLLLFSIFLVFRQLAFCNKLVLDLDNKCVLVLPNVMLRPILNKKTIYFQAIHKVEFEVDGFWAAAKRYIIVIILNDGQSLNLISTKENGNALNLVWSLSHLFKHF